MPVGLRRAVLFGFSVIGASVLRIGAAVADCPADLPNCDDTVVFPDDYWEWILVRLLPSSSLAFSFGGGSPLVLARRMRDGFSERSA